MFSWFEAHLGIQTKSLVKNHADRFLPTSDASRGPTSVTAFGFTNPPIHNLVVQA
jgi:hypothetical protein